MTIGVYTAVFSNWLPAYGAPKKTGLLSFASMMVIRTRADPSCVLLTIPLALTFKDVKKIRPGNKTVSLHPTPTLTTQSNVLFLDVCVPRAVLETLSKRTGHASKVSAEAIGHFSDVHENLLGGRKCILFQSPKAEQ